MYLSLSLYIYIYIYICISIIDNMRAWPSRSSVASPCHRTHEATRERKIPGPRVRK